MYRVILTITLVFMASVDHAGLLETLGSNTNQFG